MKNNKNSKPMTTAELVMHSPSPVAASLHNFRPQTVTPLRHKKKFKDSYKKELRKYI